MTFLAIREMKKEKFRYGLVIAVITMISFLIFILNALAFGLSRENTTAVEAWHTNSVVMSKDADGNLSQSLLTADDLADYAVNQDQAQVALTPGIMKGAGLREGVIFVGINADDLVSRSITLTKGHLSQNSDELVVSDKLRQKGFKLGQTVELGINNQNFKIVGFAEDAEYNIAPVAYGDIKEWSNVKGVSNRFVASGVVSKKTLVAKSDQVKAYSKAQFLNKMPGYSAQNSTFLFMIVFLIVISVIVVTIFLYILTIQKVQNFAVLRAQGIPSRYLALNTLSQTVIIMVSAVALSVVLALLVSLVIPTQVPMYFDIPLILLTGLGLVVMGTLGSLIPMRIIAKIDPVTVIGG
ncbi:ABC transporter permease [Convivina intestini]|uniref:ABC transporter permease n=1 Tax=Convivina intestini TaxID=1505726 RepID=UPI002010972D|nr:ABC transporter permease [Convivina intestini]CAH1853259.1 putative ABC transporter permease [Convivina intestini]